MTDTNSPKTLLEPTAAVAPRTLPALLAEASRRFAGLAAIEENGVVTGYAELPEQVMAVTRSLLARGIEEGDRSPSGRRTAGPGSSLPSAFTARVR